jgi:Predicted hydrolases or acyltransferases (alpha/beta hydrolase superfamily)
LYYEHERSGGETVVFVAGLGVGRWLWHWQREAFTDEYDLILPDNRGAGESDAGLSPFVAWLPESLRGLVLLKLAGYSISGMAADLEAVLADVGVDHAHIVGASMGGMIAQQYALEYDRAVSLALLCTTHGGETRCRSLRRRRHRCTPS